MRSTNQGRAAVVSTFTLLAAVTGCNALLKQSDGTTAHDDASTDASPSPTNGLDESPTDASPPVDADEARDGSVNIDFTTNKDHCGRLNHSCLGGDCVASKCQPVVLARDQSELSDLTFTDREVCWSFYPVDERAASGLRCVDKHGFCDGATCRTVSTTPQRAYPIYARGRLYWVPDSAELGALHEDGASLYFVSNRSDLYRLAK